MDNKILVTGGSGFIGSSFIHYLINNTEAYEIRKAKEDAAHNVPAPPSVVDPANPG